MDTNTKTTKTFDGETIPVEMVDSVAMILSNCTEKRMETLGIREKFQTFAERFISVMTLSELEEFVSHNVTLHVMNILSKI